MKSEKQIADRLNAINDALDSGRVNSAFRAEAEAQASILTWVLT